MDAIRFSILLSLFFFAGYANHTAEQNIRERRLNHTLLVKQKNGVTEENYSLMSRTHNLLRSGTEKSGGILSASLIAKNGIVIGEGLEKLNHLDPFAHATVTAVREAYKNVGMTSLKGCTLYSTEELCPMCVSLLYVADIDKIIYSIRSGQGLSTEVVMNERISRALKQKIGERPIPEIFIPYQMLDSAIPSASDGTGM